MAAGLLALLFAFGVFTPQATPGVSAHECQNPGDTHEDNTGDNPCNTDENDDGTIDDLGDGETAHAAGDHMIPVFSGADYNSDDNRYEFSIRENRDGSTTAITIGQVMATLPGGEDVSLTFTLTDPTGFTSFPSGHVQYTGSGLNFEDAALTADGERKYVGGTATFQVSARKDGAADADPGIADRTAIAMIRVYVEDQDSGPPPAPMGAPVKEREIVNAVSAADGPPVVAAVFPKAALTAVQARKAMDVTWERPEGLVEGTTAADNSTFTVEYRKVGEGDDDWETMTVPVDTTVDTDGGTDVVNIAPNMVTITGLDEKANYEIRVRVTPNEDDDNKNEWSAIGMGETASLPAAVKIAVTSEDQDSGELKVSWTNDDADGTMHDGGGDSMASYLVEYGESNTFDPDSDHNLRSHTAMGVYTTLTGLKNGTTYFVRVIPLNRLQDSGNIGERGSQERADLASESTSAIPYGEPGAPSNLQVVAASSTSLQANWQAPTDLGGFGSADINYTVKYHKANEDASTAMMMNVGATSASITGLEADTLYLVQVMATNDRGASQPATSFGRTAAGPTAVVAPSQVQDIAVQVISDTELFVSWNAPENNGGSAITGYSVRYRVIGTMDWMTVSRTGADVGQAITGLTDDTNYQVQVAAMNAEHTGPYAQATGRTNATPAAVTRLDNTLPKTFEAVSSDTPGAAVRVTLKAKLAVALDGEIKVKLDKFGLPSSIDASDVTIRSNDGVLHYQGNPTGVTISGSTITLTLGTLKGLTDSSKTLIDLMSGMVTTITIQQSAGITNPTAAGTYDLEVGSNTTTNKATIERKVSVKPTSGARGSDITVTGKGFGAGTATIELGTGDVLASNVAIEDGSFEHTLTVGDAFAAGANTINAVDGAGNRASKDNDADFTVKAKITADPDEAAPTEEITIKVSDWSAGAVSSVTFGGLKATIVAGSNTTSSSTKGQLKITVPANARVGVNKVSLNVGGESKGSVNVTVKSLGLTVEPSEAVPGERLTITGTGFVKNTDVTMITVGGKEAELPAVDDRASTSTGRIAYTITVPLDVGDGDHKVVVMVGAKKGIGAVAVPKPSVEVSPEVSAPGSVISVEGAGFASGERIEVLYDGAIEEVGRADSGGEFTIRMVVPSDAGIGTTNKVKVQVRNQLDINASADHKTPGSMITLPETAQVGTRITVSGTNFEPFTTLREVTIGGTDALPSPAPETDKNGAFEFEVRVPRLTPGNHTVTVKDGSKARNSATETFSVVTTPIVSTPQEVFGVLGDSLISVWSLDNATKKWSAYFPGAPEGVSDLTGVSSRDIVWINVSADVMFQGGMLNTGWNLISLE